MRLFEEGDLVIPYDNPLFERHNGYNVGEVGIFPLSSELWVVYLKRPDELFCDGEIDKLVFVVVLPEGEARSKYECEKADIVQQGQWREIFKQAHNWLAELESSVNQLIMNFMQEGRPDEDLDSVRNLLEIAEEKIRLLQKLRRYENENYDLDLAVEAVTARDMEQLKNAFGITESQPPTPARLIIKMNRLMRHLKSRRIQ